MKTPSYKQLRWAGHIAGLVAIVSFCRGALLYGESVSAVKAGIFLGPLLLGWFVITLVTKYFHETWPPGGEFSQALVRFQLFSIRHIFPYVFIAAFIWMAFTSWQRADREYGIGDAYGWRFH